MRPGNVIERSSTSLQHQPSINTSHSVCSVMLSIGSLPAELLIHIFETCSWSDPLAPLKLSSVCHVWHGIVFTSPRVWQSISLPGVHKDGTSTTEKLQMQASIWLKNSSPLPFDVTVDLHLFPQERFLEVIFILIGDLDRWRSCTFIKGKGRETMDISEIVLAASTRLDCTDSGSSDGDSESEEEAGRPELRVGTAAVDHLDVVVCGGSLMELQFDDEGRSHHWEDSEDEDYELEGKVPTFSRIRTGSILLDYPVSYFPFANQINPTGITVLTITEKSLDPPDPVGLLHFLTAFPEIESLTFDGRALQPDCDEDDVPPVVILPKLRVLTICCTYSIRMILSHLVVPELTNLYLQRLNTDAIIPNQPTGDDGDSEDEAHDYSQSPSSDHATGMGLRMLLKSSNPPLRVLDMDYSDLRTKDFLFCFNHFSLLSEFRIVASDMSDKVIEMLAPYGDPSGRREIRLPCLRELELEHCQRLTGGAIVDALRERVSFVDRSRTHPRMDHVSVVDCAKVLPEHNLQLSAIFGSKFHASSRSLISSVQELDDSDDCPRLSAALRILIPDSMKPPILISTDF